MASFAQHHLRVVSPRRRIETETVYEGGDAADADTPGVTKCGATNHWEPHSRSVLRQPAVILNSSLPVASLAKGE